MKIDGLKICVSGVELIEHYKALLVKLDEELQRADEWLQIQISRKDEITRKTMEEYPSQDWAKNFGEEVVRSNQLDVDKKKSEIHSAKLYAERLKPEDEYRLSKAEMKEIWDKLV